MMGRGLIFCASGSALTCCIFRLCSVHSHNVASTRVITKDHDGEVSMLMSIVCLLSESGDGLAACKALSRDACP